MPNRYTAKIAKCKNHQTKKKTMKIKLFFFVVLLTASNSLQAQYIPEISPVDIYGNLENIGFETEKDLGSEYGNFWISTNSNGGIDYKVEVKSDNASDVQSIRATAMNINRNKAEVKQFLKYVGSVLFLYRDSGESQFNRWVDSRFNSDGKTTVGQVEVEIKSPSRSVCIMNIKAN